MAPLRRALRLAAALLAFGLYVWAAAVRLLPEVKRRKAVRRRRRVAAAPPPGRPGSD